MKIKLFTHDDLDGIGCHIAMNNLWGRENIDALHCGYNSIDKEVQKFISRPANLDQYDYVFITDISIPEDIARQLDKIHHSDQGPFIQLLDHHATALWLNDYEWATVETKVPGTTTKTCGTRMILDFFDVRPGFKAEIKNGLRQFAELVRLYDTWDWDSLADDDIKKRNARWLNNYLYMIGPTRFVQETGAHIWNAGEHPSVYQKFFTDTALTLLTHRDDEVEAYIKKKLFQMLVTTTQHGEMGIVFADQHVSELGNTICKTKKDDIDYVAIIDIATNKVSFRTIRDDLDLGQVAKEFGGGGHPKAAGAQFSRQLVDGFLDSLFK